MGETVSMDDFKKERRKREFQEKVYDKVHAFADFVENNKELVWTTLTVGGAILKAGHMISKNQRHREEQYRRDRKIYDRRNGCWVETKRKLSSEEMCELDWRRRHGESVTQALRNMRLMK